MKIIRIVAIDCAIPKFLIKLKDIFKCKLTSGEMKLSRGAYNAGRGQWSANDLLEEIRKKKFDGDKILGIVDVDIYVPDLNFVFGLAEIGGKHCIISMYRLRPEFYGQRDERLFEERVLKEATHELGHCFGLQHCKGKCVMTFSNSIADVDAKSVEFCESCKAKLKL